MVSATGILKDVAVADSDIQQLLASLVVECKVEEDVRTLTLFPPWLTPVSRVPPVTIGLPGVNSPQLSSR